MTLPNLISLIRVALVPVFLWLVLGGEDYVAASLLLGFIGATDWVDGYLARRLGQVSELGKFLDPLADRLAVLAAVIAGWVAGVLPSVVAGLLVIREGLVAFGSLVIAARAGTKLSVRPLGKTATFLLYFAIPSFFMYEGTEAAVWLWFAWVVVVPGLILYYAVAFQYAGDVRRVLSSGHDPEPGDRG
jgi:cardiolipin synthase